MEDFGYSKEQEENYTSRLIRKAFLIGATLFSIACFVYITISAYFFFSNDTANIATIKGPTEPIKIIETNEMTPKEDAMQIDSSIYEDIFGTRKKTETKVIKTIEPALPPKIEEPKISEKNITKIGEKLQTQTKEEEKIIVYDSNKPNDSKVLLNNKNNVARKNQAHSIKVQIAALTSEKAANQYFKTLQNQYSSLFDGLDSYVQEVDLGKRGKFYRVQVGDFFDQVKAEQFCARYIAKTHKSKADCIVVE